MIDKHLNARAIAAQIIVPVLQKNVSLTSALNNILKQSTGDKSLIQELSYGVIRWYFSLEKIAKKLLLKPFKTKDYDVYALVLIGLYQLLFLRLPEHAAVFETVLAVKQLKKSWAANLINGILRRFIREKDQLLKSLENDIEYQYAHPLWLINQIQKAWPNFWQEILKANNEYPPMSLRVNQNKMTQASYKAILEKNQIGFKTSQNNEGDLNYFNAAITLEKPVPINDLPNFEKGLVSVQDEAAQIAAHLLQLDNGQHLLDACAAPGGKSSHILERGFHINLIALDNDSERSKKIEENFNRLALKGKIVIGDALKPEAWWDKKLFDRILLDVPCSATGVIRRHPDIKMLRRAEDLIQLAQTQLKLLKAMWPLLKKNGILVYSTCSILPAENVEVLLKFLNVQEDAMEILIDATWGHAQAVGRQILTGENGRDGFYYAVLGKEFS